VYEGGAGLVLPSYRNTEKLFSRMVVAGIQAAPDFGGQGIYGEHVCNHVYTQKVAAALGNVVMGLAVELMPADAYAQEKSAQGRVSSLFGFQTLKPYSHTVYLPQVYEESMRFLYEGLSEPRQLEISGQNPPGSAISHMTAEIYPHAGVTRITVREMGGDFVKVLGEWEDKAAERGVVVYQVWLPLSRPWVGWTVERLRERGYFLGGLLPRWFEEDGLLMQRLVHPPDWESQQIIFERSIRIARLVMDDWKQVTGGRS
jgi:hypothetical protein